MIGPIVDGFSAVVVALGVLFFALGTLGLLRFADAPSRLHALTKVDNLGLGLIVLGLLPQVAFPLGTLKLIGVWLLALLAGATTGQLLGTAVIAGAGNPSPASRTDDAGHADLAPADPPVLPGAGPT